MKARIISNNFNNLTAAITFVPDSNTSTSVNIGSQTIPYTYDAIDVYGTYTLYFPFYDKTCTFHLVPTSINSIGIGNAYMSVLRDDQINTSQDIYQRTHVGNAYMSVMRTDPI